MMPQGDAVAKIPTVEEEIARFKGFATEDGEVKAVVTDSAEEREAAAQRAEVDRVASEAAARSAAKSEGKTGAEEPGEKTGEEPGDKGPKARRLDEYGDDETLTAAEARKLLAAAVAGRVGEERRRQRNQSQQRDTELQEIRDQLRRLEAGGLTPKPAGGTPGSTSTEKAPDPKDYEHGEFDVRFIEDRTRYAVRQEMNAQREQDSQKQQREAATREEREFAQKKEALIDSGLEKYPDFQEAVLDTVWTKDNPEGWPLSPTLGALIFENPEVGRVIAYELAGNPKEARRVFGLTPTQQAAYFGRQEARITSPGSQGAAGKDPAKPAAQPVKVSQVPPPPANRARGASATQPDGATQDFKAFERLAGY